MSIEKTDFKIFDPEKDRQCCEAPVKEVTLMEDRAQVVRCLEIKLLEGLNKIIVPDVSPVIVDKSLFVSLPEEKDKDVTVADARIVRRKVICEEDKSEVTAETRGKIQNLKNKIKLLKDSLNVLNESLEDLKEVLERTYEDFSEDAAWGIKDLNGWQKKVKNIRTQEMDTRDLIFKKNIELNKLEKELTRLKRNYESMETPRDIKTAAILIDISLKEKSNAKLTLNYIVPGACWRPYHTARLLDENVEFQCAACVWQNNTGEDWHDVQLYFSTKRFSQGTEPPLLSTDYLTKRRKEKEILTETREQELFDEGYGQEQGETREEISGIDDGGDIVNLKASRKAVVPSTGEPYKVQISAFESPVEKERILIPEISSAVILKSVQTNCSKTPILPGPVDLIKNNGLIGRTRVKYSAPDERFGLSWGGDGDLRVERQAESYMEKQKMLSKWKSEVFKVDIYISNLGPNEKVIELTERIPISEIEKVKIELDSKETTDGITPDKNGFLKWSLNLKSYDHQTVSLKYVKKQHYDVV